MVRPHSAPPVSPTSLQTTPYPPSLRIMSGHCKVSGLTTRWQHTPTDSKLTPKSISKESQEKHEVQTKTSYTKTYQEDKLPLGRRSQGRQGLQFTNPGTFQLLIAPMVTGRIASDLSIETLEDPPPTPKSPTPLQTAIGNLGPAEAGRGVEPGWGWGQGFPVTSPVLAAAPPPRRAALGKPWTGLVKVQLLTPYGTFHAPDSHCLVMGPWEVWKKPES